MIKKLQLDLGTLTKTARRVEGSVCAVPVDALMHTLHISGDRYKFHSVSLQAKLRFCGVMKFNNLLKRNKQAQISLFISVVTGKSEHMLQVACPKLGNPYYCNSCWVSPFIRQHLENFSGQTHKSFPVVLQGMRLTKAALKLMTCIQLGYTPLCCLVKHLGASLLKQEKKVKAGCLAGC